MTAESDPPLRGGAMTAPAEVLVQELPDDELMFLDTRTDAYFTLDSVGARMYRALTDAPDREEAVTRLREELHAPADRVRGDLDRFADQLVERGLLEFSS